MSKNKNPIHGTEGKKFYEKKWLVETVTSGPPVVGAGVAAFLASTPQITVALLASMAWLLVGQVLKISSAYRQDSKDEELRSHDGLIAAMHVLHASVKDALQRLDGSDPELRATFHRVLPPLDDPQQIEQIIPYVGGGNDGKDRKFSVRSGITGCAVRTGTDCFVMDRQGQSEDAYRQELIADWHYTAADVKKMTMDRFSAIAVPVTDLTGQHVIGVIYLDAKRKSCFSGETLDLVLGACGGISKYVGVRYG